jgi:hypothetical protein
LFCQNVPVDQQAERIIFTINGDNTISAYVQINYTGAAPDFSWVVPVPAVPAVDVAEMATFDELSRLTSPIIISPLMPSCAPIPTQVAMMSREEVYSSTPVDDVQVLASGTAGPYAYDVVRTESNPKALVTWLRDNNYNITVQMEPLVDVYVNEGLSFLAMKLQPEQGVQDIQPVVMTYDSPPKPMIPLRLTAVAANPNMTVITWIFADERVIPENYAHPVIEDEDIRGNFSQFGGTNYLLVVDATVDLYEGRAFITEYAQPTSSLRGMNPSDPLLRLLAEKYKYLTRFFGRISPEEMTADPAFVLSDNLPDVSNVRDLSNADAEIFWGCKTEPVSVEYDPSVVPPGF